MRSALIDKSSLSSVLWLDTNHKVAYTAFVILLGTLLLAISAKIYIPLGPVPLTMQSLMVLFVGMALGWRLGGITVFLYLLLGFYGLPMFVEHTGRAVLAEPTAGYLVGMLPAAIISGYLVEQGWGRSNLGAAMAATIGLVVIYAFGLGVLSRFLGWPMAVNFGVYPFLFVDLLKVLFLTFLIPLIWKPRSAHR